MKKFFALILALLIFSGFGLLAAEPGISKSVNEYGETIYTSLWKPGPPFEEVKLMKYQQKKDRDEWTILLHVKVAAPRLLSSEAARLQFEGTYYDIDTFFTNKDSWRPYRIGQQTPTETDPLIPVLANRTKLKIGVILSDGSEIEVDVPAQVLQDWGTVLAFRAQ